MWRDRDAGDGAAGPSAADLRAAVDAAREVIGEAQAARSRRDAAATDGVLSDATVDALLAALDLALTARGSRRRHRAGTLLVDPDSHAVEHRGKRRMLTRTEYRLLTALMSHRGEVAGRRELAAEAWGEGYANRTGEVEVYVSRLRRKLTFDGERPAVIETVRGAGYRLVLNTRRAVHRPDR